jgi:hypothetical protein
VLPAREQVVVAGPEVQEQAPAAALAEAPVELQEPVLAWVQVPVHDNSPEWVQAVQMPVRLQAFSDTEILDQSYRLDKTMRALL